MFDLNELKNQLYLLPALYRTVFAASCCERIIPAYKRFCLPSDANKHKVLQQSLNAIWEFIFGAVLTEQHILRIIEECKSQNPDEDRHDSLFYCAAQNTVSALVYALQSCATGDVQLTAFTAQILIDALDNYLYRVNYPYINSASQIDIIKEFSKQKCKNINLIESQNNIVDELKTQQQAFDVWLQQSPLMTNELTKQHQDIMLLSGAKVTQETLKNIRSLSQTIGSQFAERYFG